MNAAESDARLYALLKARGCIEPFDDPHMLKAEILSILFNLIPNANRVALLLSREDAPQVPDHFWCEAYGKRTGEPKRFKLSREAIEFVYRYGHPYTSQNAICAPLLRENLFVMGLIYLDTRKRRGFDDVRQLCSGPGKLTQAFAISGRNHEMDLCADPSHCFAANTDAAVDVVADARIGITRSAHYPWRFTLRGSDFVSRPVKR